MLMTQKSMKICLVILKGWAICPNFVGEDLLFSFVCFSYSRMGGGGSSAPMDTHLQLQLHTELIYVLKSEIFSCNVEIRIHGGIQICIQIK